MTFFPHAFLAGRRSPNFAGQQKNSFYRPGRPLKTDLVFAGLVHLPQRTKQGATSQILILFAISNSIPHHSNSSMRSPHTNSSYNPESRQRVLFSLSILVLFLFSYKPSLMGNPQNTHPVYLDPLSCEVSSILSLPFRVLIIPRPCVPYPGDSSPLVRLGYTQVLKEVLIIYASNKYNRNLSCSPQPPHLPPMTSI